MSKREQNFTIMFKRTEQHNTTTDLKLKKSRSSNGKDNNGSNGITWRITTAREARTIT